MIAVIINPISGGSSLSSSSSACGIGRRVAVGERAGGPGIRHRTARPRARARAGGTCARRRPRDRVGRRRDDQRSGLGAGLRTGRARPRPGGLGQRAGAGARHRPSSRERPCSGRGGSRVRPVAAVASTRVSWEGDCSSTSPASASTPTSPRASTAISQDAGVWPATRALSAVSSVRYRPVIVSCPFGSIESRKGRRC